MKKSVSIFITLCLIISLISCQSPQKTNSDALSIVCTIFPYYDICKEVVQDNANVTILNNSGTDLHNYEPTLKDIKLISECDVFIYGGGTSDLWVINTVAASQNDDIKLIRLMDHVTTFNEEFKEGMQADSHDHEHDEKHHHNDSDIHEIDEHIWLSLENATIIAETICQTVQSIDPVNSDYYQNNFNTFSSEANKIDGLYRDLFYENTTPLIFADRFAFRYMTESYDLTYFAAFPGCSTESFASFNTIAFLMKTVKDYNIDCILTIDTSNSQLAQTVANETGCKIFTLNSCQSVTQKEIDNGLTYLQIMKNNYQILSEVIS